MTKDQLIEKFVDLNEKTNSYLDSVSMVMELLVILMAALVEASSGGYHFMSY